jgi:acetyltransferase-like isoleucine patch superfamily enzyme
MLGLIVGESSLPNYVINKLLKKNIEFLILDLTKSNIYKRYKNSYSLKITELGKAISILKKNNCNNVIIANNVAIAGHVEIDDNVIIGGNSAVQQFTRIGKLAMIGGMTGVEKDVIPYGLVTGNRAHLEGINIIGLKRAGYSSDEINGLNQAVKLIFSNDILKNGITEAKKFSNLKTVSEVISFLEKSEKRAICRPLK